MTRFACFALIVTLSGSSAAFSQSADLGANSPPPAMGASVEDIKPEAAAWIAKRVAWIQEVYALDSATGDRLSRDARMRVPAQIEYQKKFDPTVRSLSKALENQDNPQVAQQMPDPALRERTKLSLTNQLAGYNARAPLSYQSLVALAESMMDKDRVAAGRAKLEEVLGAKMPPGTDRTTLYTRIDAVLGEKSWMPGVDATPANPPTGASASALTGAAGAKPMTQARPTPAESISPQRPNPPPIKPTPAPMPQPVTPAAPPRVVPPAPPVETWGKTVDEAITKFQLDPAKTAKAKSLFEYYMKRLPIQREKDDAARRAAESLSDPVAREKAMKESGKGVDTLYDDMIHRIEMLATVEQREKVARAEGRAPVAPTPANPHAGHNH